MEKSSGDISEILRAFMESRALLTGVELDIFAAAGDGCTAVEIASRIGADPRATEMLLNALAAMEFLEKKDSIFAATNLSHQCLTREGRLATMATVDQWRRWSMLTDRVRSGASVIEELLEDRVREYVIAQSQNLGATPDQYWIEAFIAVRHQTAAERAPLVIRAVDPSGVHRMLDIGGGSGAYAIAFAQANSELQAEVLDLVPSLNIPQRYIKEAGLSARVHTRVGDLRSNELGRDYGLILMSTVCDMLSEKENQDLFRRCHAAGASGGRFVIQDYLLDPSKTSPRHAALFSLNMLVNTRHGASYSVAEYHDWLCAAGFSEIKCVRLPGPTDLLTAKRV